LLPGVEPLAHDHHVVLFDFRGCGLSSRGLPDDALQPEHVIGDAHALIGKLDLGSVVLLGFSTGGRAAVELVRRFLHDVRRLILASTSAYPAGDAEPYLRDWSEPRRRQAMEDAAGGTLRNSTVFVWSLDLAPAYLALIHAPLMAYSLVTTSPSRPSDRRRSYWAHHRFVRSECEFDRRAWEVWMYSV